MTTLPTRTEMEEKLGRVFAPEQTVSLVEVLDTIRQVEVERAVDTQELKRGLTELAEEIKKLVVAQQHTENALAQLSQVVATGFTDLRQTVGSLTNTFGFSLEEFVAALLPSYLEHHYGLTDLTLERRYFEVASQQFEEVDLAGEALRNGQPVIVLVECRTTVGGGEIRRLTKKLETVAGALADRAVVKVVVAMNLHPTAETAAKEGGILAVPYSRINRER